MNVLLFILSIAHACAVQVLPEAYFVTLRPSRLSLRPSLRIPTCPQCVCATSAAISCLEISNIYAQVARVSELQRDVHDPEAYRQLGGLYD